MKVVALLGAFSLMTGAGGAAAEEAAGDWLGSLKVSSQELHLALHIQKSPDGSYSGGLDSLDQGARNIPLADVKATPEGLAFTVPSIRASYVGKWDQSAQRWVGSYTQGATALSLDLVRGKVPPAPVVTGLDGFWDGALDVNGAKLRLVLHITTAPDTGTFAAIRSVDQNINAAVTSVSRSGDDVSLEMKFSGTRFTGHLAPDGARMEGTWSQGILSLPLIFARRAEGVKSPTANRPQTPVAPFPYRQEEVAFDNSNAAGPVRLAGTLTLPPGKGPFPAVVLIAGSGRNTRDVDAFGHKLFLVLADHLTRQGLAVLRYDKRGVAQSSGDYAKATSLDFASDAEAALGFLRSRKDIDPARTGLVGHSEGGLIAPMVAADDHRVAFVVLMAGPGENGLSVITQQGRLINQSFGLKPEDAAEGDAIRGKLFEVVRTEPDPAKAQAELRRLMTEAAKKRGVSEAVIEPAVQALATEWFRLFLNYDPAEALRKLTCPVLAINGSKDLQVPPEENLAAIKSALAGHKDVTVEEMPGLNHLFQTAVTGSPLEYATSEETMAPLALNTISDWIADHVRRSDTP